jgi:hypothetical protein
MLSNLPFDIRENIHNDLSDKDMMNLFNINKNSRNFYKKHISALILKNYLNLHEFENTDKFCYIVGFYSSIDLLKYLQYVFDTPLKGYSYNPFTSDVTKTRSSDFKWTRVISRRNKTLDGLLDLFY